ncbi:MAG: HEAT repeat domain-containing protein [Planctomycetaceae bacterium]|nr:HEAT repeat domain-containing protein [Planctomycetaceae bacterium]
MVFLAALVLQATSDDAVRKLIEQLSADRIEARAEAYRKLEEVGRPALPLLRKAASDPDDEVSSRARTLLIRIPIREHLTPALLAGVPGIYDRLAGGDWRAVFLDIAGDVRQPEGRRKYPGVRPDDLSFMAPMALDCSREPAERVAVCQAIGRLRLRAAIPSILKLLPDENVAVRTNAIGALRDLDAREEAAALRPFLTDPNVLIRSVAAHAVGRLGDAESVPGLRKLLGDESANVRWWAARALGDLKAREAADDLARLAQDPDESVRRIAAEILKGWIK